MILGIGVDILDIRRIQHLIEKFGIHFISKYFCQQEIDFCNGRKERIASFAKIFAIKESAIKAVGDKRGMTWHSLKIMHDSFGKPHLSLYCDKYREIPNKKIFIHTTTSDEPPYVVATTIIESCESFD